MGLKTRRGLTMIELLVVLAILTILILMAFFSWKPQIAKGRDARRKGDLDKMQKAFEDYYNDEGCYPDPTEISSGGIICKESFSPYLSELPCDPQNSSAYHYFYNVPDDETCKSWYKIYTKFENTEDPNITKVGCTSGCGPSDNYDYLVSSPNAPFQVDPREIGPGCKDNVYACFSPGVCQRICDHGLCWPDYELGPDCGGGDVCSNNLNWCD